MNKSSLRIVFMGTPDFALPCFNMLVESGYSIVGVVTQPDRPKGRGHRLVAPPVKEAATALGIPVLQPERISRDGFDALRSLEPDLLITAAFGQILSRDVLALPKYGCINVHASLLPKYRGAAPIEWAIINGETVTGVTTMYTVYELDAGDILLSDSVDITPDMTGGELRELLSRVGAGTLSRTLDALLDGSLTRTPQAEADSSYYPIPDRELSLIDFKKPSLDIKNLIRAMNPSSPAYCYCGGEKVKIYEADIIPGGSGAPGDVLYADTKRGLAVCTGDGSLRLKKLQFPGGKQLDDCVLLCGKSLTGKRFSSEEQL